MKKFNIFIISLAIAAAAAFSGCSAKNNGQYLKEESLTENSNQSEMSISDSRSSDTETSVSELSDLETSDTDALGMDVSEETISPAVSGLDTDSSGGFSLNDISEYSGEPYCVINNNVPYFSEEDLTTSSFEEYSSLDELGRCGVCVANIGQDLMPTEKRGEIGKVKPTGWHTVKYDFIDGKYLYNRCHLIGYQLTAENANEKNLITGTRYLNVEGMLPFENMVADYVKETGNHVLYRVTPIFEGDDLLASGVTMEAMSVEDGGSGIMFNVFCYNVQPGVLINYKTGETDGVSGDAMQSTDSNVKADQSTVQNTAKNEADSEEQDQPQITENTEKNGQTYVLNTSTKKFHYPSCPSADDIKAKNKSSFKISRDELISQGYVPCKRCNP